MNQGSGCSMAAAYLSPDVAREIYGGKRDVVAWGQGPGAKAIRTEGGWRVSGTWSFASGSRHATWLGAMCPSYTADGIAMVRPDGRAWDRTFMFRREKARIDDVWQVMGLRGTGSDNYTIKDLLVDDAHSLTREYEPERQQHGPLYSFQAMQLYASGFASVALGVSRAMLDGLIALARTKSQAWSADALRDNNAVQHIVGYSDAAWRRREPGCTSRSTMRRAMSRGPACCRWNTAWRSVRRQLTRSTSPATWRIRCSMRPARPRFSQASIRAAVARCQQYFPAVAGTPDPF
jgi:hypothetical protein